MRSMPLPVPRDQRPQVLCANSFAGRWHDLAAFGLLRNPSMARWGELILAKSEDLGHSGFATTLG